MIERHYQIPLSEGEARAILDALDGDPAGVEHGSRERADAERARAKLRAALETYAVVDAEGSPPRIIARLGSEREASEWIDRYGDRDKRLRGGYHIDLEA